ncbi:MAG: carbohydrate binding family 9 domain-containing protein [Fimbriimonadaceae bacterium]|nr:carbohydrate binding family 9 domain-containing protein [Fimbriimonadaceae bacterium]
MRFAVVGGLLMLVHGVVWGQESARKLPAAKIVTPPVIDGKLGDGEWEQASHCTGFVERFDGSAPVEKTEVWIGYDDKAIFVAFKCYDSEPQKIVAREIKPGVDLSGDDVVVFRIDPFNTQQYGSTSFFRVNAIGTQSEEIAGGRASKREWRGDWQAAAQKTDFGYVVEMRIPWEVIDHPTGGEPRDLNFNFVRWHGRQSKLSIWSFTTSSERPELNATWQGVQMPTSRSKPKIQLLPYTVGEWDFENSKIGLDAGLDVKIPISSQLTGVASFNPDFKNIEQSVVGIEFTRSERFLGDTRPFFAEGGSLFNLTWQHSIGRLFYSRRIADFDVGTKGYGKLTDKIAVGALATLGQDDEVNGAFNLDYDADAMTQYGLFGTTHNGSGRQNSAVGANVLKRLGNWFVSGEGIREMDANYNASAYSYSVDYQVPTLFATLRHMAIDPDFRPALAFIPFNDRRGTYLYSEYGRQLNDSWIQSYDANFFASSFDHYDGTEDEHGWDLSLGLRTRNDQRTSVSYENRVWEGARDTVWGVGHTIGQSNRFQRFNIYHQFGKRADQSYKLYSASGSLRVMRRIDVGAQYNKQEYFGTDDQFVGTVSWEIDAKRSLSGRLVQTNGTTNWYVAFRSAGFKGAELFVILGDPNTAEFRQRLAIKLVIPVG